MSGIIPNRIYIELNTKHSSGGQYITNVIMVGNIGEKKIESEVGYHVFNQTHSVKLHVSGYKMIKNFKEASISDRLDSTILIITQKLIELAQDIREFSDIRISEENLKEFNWKYAVI